MTEEHYRRLENMYMKAPVNELYTPEISISEGEAEITMPVQEKFFHSGGAAHGSFYFKALDDAAYFAAGSLVDSVFLLTVSMTIHLSGPVSEGSVRAVGKVTSTSQSQILAESIMYDSRDTEIARASGVFVRSKIPLTSAGY